MSEDVYELGAVLHVGGTNQIVHGLCTGTRPVSNCRSDGKSSDTSTQMPGQHRQREGNQPEGTRKAFQKKELLELRFERQVGVSKIHMENKALQVDRAACAKSRGHQMIQLVMHAFSKSNIYAKERWWPDLKEGTSIVSLVCSK